MTLHEHGAAPEELDQPGYPGLGTFQYLTIAIGCMIGIGWITVLGEWLLRAGPIGAIVGFILGACVMIGVAACYAELSGMMPMSGGDVVFANRVLGRDASFFVGWFLILMAISVAAFEALSFAWVVETLLPSIGALPLYRAFGDVVTLQQGALAGGVILVLLIINSIGVNASARTQDVLTTFKLLVVAVFLVVALLMGQPSRLFAVTSEHAQAGAIGGALWIAATSAFWFGGFQVISQAAEDRSSSTSIRTIGWITVGSVIVALVFYVSVVVAAVAAAPVAAIVAAPLPAAKAAEAAFGSRMGATAVLLAGIAGILATLNAMLLSGSRLSLALARFRFFPRRFARMPGKSIPSAGLVAVAICAFIIVFGGRGLLIPMVDTASISLIISYVLVCVMVLRLRRTAPEAVRPFRVPGGTAAVWVILAAVACMAIFIILEPVFNGWAVPVQWIIFAAWGGLGIVIWGARRSAPRVDASRFKRPRVGG